MLAQGRGRWAVSQTPIMSRKDEDNTTKHFQLRTRKEKTKNLDRRSQHNEAFSAKDKKREDKKLG